MARVAQVIGQIEDAWGDVWDVREYRPTTHGFLVALGWPAGVPRGRGGSGGPRVILTPPLVKYMASRRYPARGVDLPIGMTAVKRLRALLAIDWQADHHAWWLDRIEDLTDMTLAAFAEVHGVKEGAVQAARSALLGPILRPAGWWHQEDVVDILADHPAAIAAERLGLAVSSVRRMQSHLFEPLKRSGLGKDDIRR